MAHLLGAWLATGHAVKNSIAPAASPEFRFALERPRYTSRCHGRGRGFAVCSLCAPHGWTGKCCSELGGCGSARSCFWPYISFVYSPVLINKDHTNSCVFLLDTKRGKAYGLGMRLLAHSFCASSLIPSGSAPGTEDLLSLQSDTEA